MATYPEIIDLENAGVLDQALLKLYELCLLSRSPIKSFYENGLSRMIDRIDGNQVIRGLNTRQLFGPAVEICPSRQVQLPRPIVSLACIESRLDGVFRTVETLLAQDLPPKTINLYLSSEPYLIDKGVSESDKRLELLHGMGVDIYFTKNIGPYRKQYPLIESLRKECESEDTIFITVDDDVLYPTNALRGLVETLIATDSVTAHRGRALSFNDSALTEYGDFGIPEQRTSLNNLGTGKNGIAYKLGYFPIDWSLYIGPLIAPTADDLWCKWVTSMYCIPTTITDPKAAFDSGKEFEEVSPDLKVGLFHNYNAKGRNDIAIQALEIYFKEAQTSLHQILRV